MGINTRTLARPIWCKKRGNVMRRIIMATMNQMFPVIFFLATVGVACQENDTSVRSLISHLLNCSRYDATIRPEVTPGSPTKVNVDVVMTSLGPINDSDMDFFTTLYLRQEWNDPRLTFDSPNRTVVVSHKRLPQLWVPDLFFPQAKEEKSHDLTTPNILIRLAPNGTVLYSMRLTLRLRCMMTLQKFPLDEQTCKIQLESYAYTLDDMELVWSAKRKRINVLPEAYLPDFRITNNETLVCEAEYETGRFPCLAATLTLQREIGYYMIQTYIPTILIVMLSWASFWIDHEAVPARISVGLLTVLTITTQGSGVLAQLPKVPYIKSIDVWMSTCLVFVFVSYMEYAVVAVLTRQYRKGVNQRRIYSQNSKRASSKSSISSSPEVKTNGVGPTLNDSSDTLYHSDENLALSFLSKEDYGRKLEKISRYLFPSSFIIFNLVYWTVYVYL